jgi:phosphoribosylformimino-5-aminoimidazole carboxamide ribotide isomerase
MPGSLPIETIILLEEHCSEFLVHAADVEGLCRGIDEDLVRSEQTVRMRIIAHHANQALENGSAFLPRMQEERRVRQFSASLIRGLMSCTGVADLNLVDELSNGKVDLTYGR